MKPARLMKVIRRWLAEQDVEQAISHYLTQSPRAALGLVDALESGFEQIRRHPEAGSPRYAHELDLPGVRSLPLGRYPYVVFYVVGADAIDVWRVLHAHRDIPELFRDGD